MILPPLPRPYSEAYVDFDQFWPDIYSKEQMQAFYKKGYEQALLDAMNATIPFGKTGAVIAAAIGALK